MRNTSLKLDRVEAEMLRTLIKRGKSEFRDLPKMVKELIKNEYEKTRLPR